MELKILQNEKLFLRSAEMSREGIKGFYAHIKEDFPRNERIPFFFIKRRFLKGQMKAVYLTNGSNVFGYALHHVTNGITHINYLAVLKEYRAHGYGSVLLSLLKEEGAMFLEVENPEKAENEKEKQIRLKRISFYEKNGLETVPGITLNLYGVSMLLMVCGIEGERDWNSTVRNSYRKITGTVIPKGFVSVSTEQ